MLPYVAQYGASAGFRGDSLIVQQLTEPILAALVAGHLDVPPGSVRLERCPTGKHNQTWFVAAGERSLVLRIAPPDDPARMLFYEHRMTRQEPELHRLLRERTSAPVPAIITAKWRLLVRKVS